MRRELILSSMLLFSCNSFRSIGHFSKVFFIMTKEISYTETIRPIFKMFSIMTVSSSRQYQRTTKKRSLSLMSSFTVNQLLKSFFSQSRILIRLKGRNVIFIHCQIDWKYHCRIVRKWRCKVLVWPILRFFHCHFRLISADEWNFKSYCFSWMIQ